MTVFITHLIVNLAIILKQPNILYPSYFSHK